MDSPSEILQKQYAAIDRAHKKATLATIPVFVLLAAAFMTLSLTRVLSHNGVRVAAVIFLVAFLSFLRFAIKHFTAKEQRLRQKEMEKRLADDRKWSEGLRRLNSRVSLHKETE